MISIVIPTLNEEKRIATTIQKLRDSLHRPYEIIISDGASSDGTVEIARNLADGVAEHTLPYRQTIAEGRNNGAAIARPTRNNAASGLSQAFTKQPPCATCARGVVLVFWVSIKQRLAAA